MHTIITTSGTLADRLQDLDHLSARHAIPAQLEVLQKCSVG